VAIEVLNCAFKKWRSFQRHSQPISLVGTRIGAICYLWSSQRNANYGSIVFLKHVSTAGTTVTFEFLVCQSTKYDSMFFFLIISELFPYYTLYIYYTSYIILYTTVCRSVSPDSSTLLDGVVELLYWAKNRCEDSHHYHDLIRSDTIWLWIVIIIK
jgi:hypothetical protein